MGVCWLVSGDDDMNTDRLKTQSVRIGEKPLALNPAECVQCALFNIPDGFTLRQLFGGRGSVQAGGGEACRLIDAHACDIRRQYI